MKPEEVILQRNSSSCRSSRKILPANYVRSTVLPATTDGGATEGPLVPKYAAAAAAAVPYTRPNKSRNVAVMIRSLLGLISMPSIFPTHTCRWLSIPARFSPAPSLGRRVTGTLFGHKKGHVSFVVQEDPRSEPVILLELAMSTSALVKEMSSGLVRIALECDKGSNGNRSSVKLFQEPMWKMYCNGRKCGYAVSRTCGDSDWHVLSTVQTVSIGAGVIPVDKNSISNGSVWEGELMYMRAKFERVVGSRDSEAFYMMNPDGTGGPELSIFLLRI